MASVSDIPINKHLGITYVETTKRLVLDHDPKIGNYFGTTSFCAQFVLAEAASAQYMHDHLGLELSEAIPSLRQSETQYFKPTAGKSFSKLLSISCSQEQFQKRMREKGRISVKVAVAILSETEETALKSTFSWLIIRHKNK